MSEKCSQGLKKKKKTNQYTGVSFDNKMNKVLMHILPQMSPGNIMLSERGSQRPHMIPFVRNAQNI